jgi:acyl carrier protein
MLALEDAFEIEFPERMLRRRTFESVAAIRDAVAELTGSHGLKAAL